MLCIGILAIGAGCAFAVESTERTVKRLLARTSKPWVRGAIAVSGAVASFGLVVAQMVLSLLLVWCLGDKK